MLINGTHAAARPSGVGTGTNGTNGTNGTTGGAGSTGGTGSTGGSGSTPSVGGTTLGGTDFLTLMLAQLKNQDPTSPVDSNTFLSQLAELSQVQGITTLNTTLTNSLASSQAMQASSLLGHQALVNTTTATLTPGTAITGAVSVPQTTSKVVLSITDSNGVLVNQINLGAQSAGSANFSWDGTNSGGSKAPAGSYTLTAQYAGATADSGAATTAVNGIVESVSMGAGAAGLTLNVAGVGSVPFSSVQTISN
jgi:flagellar basal-body rod modification protein FlgD